MLHPGSSLGLDDDNEDVLRLHHPVRLHAPPHHFRAPPRVAHQKKTPRGIMERPSKEPGGISEGNSEAQQGHSLRQGLWINDCDVTPGTQGEAFPDGL